MYYRKLFFVKLLFSLIKKKKKKKINKINNIIKLPSFFIFFNKKNFKHYFFSKMSLAKISDYLKKFDLFGDSITLRFNNKKKFQTLIGAGLALIFDDFFDFGVFLQ